MRSLFALAMTVPLIAVAASPAAAQATAPAAPTSYPPTRIVNQVDDYFGTKVADPYRWLEDDNAPDTKAWVESQNAVTFGYLAGIGQRDAIRARLTTLWNYERYGLPRQRGAYFIYTRNDGLQNQAVYYRARSLDATPEVLLDPNALSADGTVAVGSTTFSDDGRYMAYSLSESGSDWIRWRVREIATGKDLLDEIRWSKFSGAAWLKDGSGFFYSRYDAPKAGEALTGVNKNQKIYFHRLGTSQDADTLVYARPDQPDWGLGADVTDDGKYLLISQSEGTDPKNRIFVKDLTKPDSKVEPFLNDFDASYNVVGNDDATFYVLTNQGAPRKRLVAITLGQASPSAWKTLIPEGPKQDVLDDVTMAANQFVATWQIDAQNRLRIYDLGGALTHEVALPGIGAVQFSGRRVQPEGFYAFASFARPTAVFALDVATGRSSLFRQPTVAFDPTQYETTQVFYPSKDGTRIPMFITHKKGLQRNGANPTYLYGYGGFDISLTPSFSPANLAWMEMGGVYAVANLRGGGEYGKAWHDAGRLANKQNVFDDFIAAAEYLISEKYTSTREARHRRRQQRRPARGCGDDAAPGPLRRRPAGGRRDGHAPLPQVHDRLGVEVRLRQLGNEGGLRRALQVLAAAQPEARHRVPGDDGDHGGPRRPRGAGPQLQVRGGAAGRPQGAAAGPDPHRDQGRTRRRQADQQADRRSRRQVGVPRGEPGVLT